jgi:hypothetical protein
MLVLQSLEDSNANNCRVVLMRVNQMSIMPLIVLILISPTSSALSLLWIQIVANNLFKKIKHYQYCGENFLVKTGTLN